MKATVRRITVQILGYERCRDCNELRLNVVSFADNTMMCGACGSYGPIPISILTAVTQQRDANAERAARDQARAAKRRAAVTT